MDYDWDEAKNAANRREYGIDFASVERFGWDLADIEIDDREDYGELREVAYSFLGHRLHTLVFTRRGEAIRSISLRKSDKKEMKRYGRNTR